MDTEARARLCIPQASGHKSHSAIRIYRLTSPDEPRRPLEGGDINRRNTIALPGNLELGRVEADAISVRPTPYYLSKISYYEFSSNNHTQQMGML